DDEREQRDDGRGGREPGERRDAPGGDERDEKRERADDARRARGRTITNQERRARDGAGRGVDVDGVELPAAPRCEERLKKSAPAVGQGEFFGGDVEMERFRCALDAAGHGGRGLGGGEGFLEGAGRAEDVKRATGHWRSMASTRKEER